MLWFSSGVALVGSGLYEYTLGVLNTSLTTLCADLGISEELHGAAAVSAGGFISNAFNAGAYDRFKHKIYAYLYLVNVAVLRVVSVPVSLNQ